MFRIALSAAVACVATFAVGIWITSRNANSLVPLSIPADIRSKQYNEVDPFSDESTGPGTENAQSEVLPSVREPLKGIDLHGTLHRLDEGGQRAIGLVFLGTQCPISNAAITGLNVLAAECSRQNVGFFGVISSPSVSRREALEHAREYAVQFPVLFDTTAELRTAVGATHAPHAFLLASSGDVLYRGAIDDCFAAVGQKRGQITQNYLRNAIDDVLQGRTVRQPETVPIGCLLERIPDGASFPPGGAQAANDSKKPITFARQIAPIIFANCATCHHDGSVAPFPLTCFDDVKRHAAQIRLMVDLRQMPPWRPVRGFGKFRDQLVLTGVEIELIKRWVDDGLPLGDPSDLPNPPVFPDGWQLGTPDLVLSVPEPFSVPAAGNDIYQYFVIPTQLPGDRLVSAIEYRPGNARVVHHASFRYDDAGQARKLDADFNGPGYQRFGGWGFTTGGTLGGWAMGILPQRFASGFGRPIKADSDFILQTHYHPTGKPEKDQGTVGIYFASSDATRQIGELFIANLKLHIPPHERRFAHHAEYALPVDVTVFSVLPHMHLLGREIKAVAILPSGEHVPLIWIDDWRFDWQGQYFYAQPQHLPAGTRIEFDVVFDNSALNPLNPHSPPRWVHWGEETAAEMAVCFFDVAANSQAELERLLAHNRQYVDAQRAVESQDSLGSTPSR